MRRPKPWYWVARGGWYVQVGGKQVALGKAEGKTRVPPPAVTREYHRLLAQEGLVDERARHRAPVPEVCEAFLATRAKLREGTRKSFAFHLRKLCETTMTRAFASLRADDVRRIAEGVGTWGEGTRHDFASRVSTLFRWARDAGYLEMNPLAGWRNPYAAGARKRVLSDEEFRMILDCARDIEFRQVMMFLRGTGCRPGEARRVTAAHVHPDRPLVVLAPAEHKTGRTGKERVLVLPADVEVMVRALCRQYPAGPLFRNSRQRTRGWCEGALPRRFRVYRRRLGLPEDTVPYLVRHSTLSRLLDGGTDVHLAAKIAGHAGVSTLMTTYYHPDVDRMAAALDESHRFRKE